MVANKTQKKIDEDLKCIECNFEGVSRVKLKWHMNKNHWWPDIIRSDKMDIGLLSTDPRICGKCWYEAEDLYDFDSHTWGEHDDDASVFETSEQVTNNFKCNFCEETFAIKRDLMQHKKINHEKR